MGIVEGLAAANVQKQKANAYDAAVRAAEMQDVVNAARQQGASEYAQGLAKLGAEQAYMDAGTAPAVAMTGNASVGGRNFYGPQTNEAPVDQTMQWLNEMRARKAAQ